MVRSSLVIVVPAFNEEKTIESVVKECKFYADVIVVDDASDDLTGAKAQQAGANVIKHLANRGYDSAIESGFLRARELGYQYLITVDADGQHDLSMLKQYFTLLKSGAKVVVGVRPKRPRLAEVAFGIATNLIYGLKDPLCGMKGYAISLYEQLGYFDSYKSIGTDLTFFALKNSMQVEQIPINVYERSGVSKFGGSIKGNIRIMRSLGLFFVYYCLFRKIFREKSISS